METSNNLGILVTLHSYWAYVVLALLVIALINALAGKSAKRNFSGKDYKLSLFAFISTHIQLLLGLLVYGTSPKGMAVLGEMKQADLRLTSLEHPLMSLIAIVLITVGWSQHKKAEGTLKFNKIILFYGLGLLLIALRLPWNQWFA